MSERHLGKYRVVEQLGAGGMGEVYLAEDTRLGRQVALKVLPEAFVADHERVARLEQEARLLAALSHPNVATLFGLEEVDGAVFLVMERIRGESLAERVRRAPLPVAEALRIAEQVAAAVAAAHQAGIVHRDLKPANVMLTPEGQVKVLDFGIATAVPLDAQGRTDDTPTVAAMTAAGEVMGTVAYMSPEQARGEAATPATDIWGVGAILYEMLAGEPPFGGDNLLATLQGVQHDPPSGAARVQRAVPRPVWKIVDRALAKTAAQRQASMAELGSALAAARTEIEGGAAQEAASALRLFRRPPAIAALVILVALGGWYATSQMRLRAEQRWAREEAIPEITAIAGRLLGNDPSDEAWRAIALARRAERALPDDPTLDSLWEEISVAVEVDERILAAHPQVRGYADASAPWAPLEVLPSGRARMARGFSRLRLEFEGQAPIEVLSTGYLGDQLADFYLEHPAPSGMVAVPGREPGPGSFVSLTGLGEPRQAFEPFFMDRYETTNREYREFVEAGGYSDPQYWIEAVEQDGRELSFEESRPLFLDETGRPGPATWQLGTYPEGRDEYPVSGVSWYEALAYARFRGKSLPSIFHWDRAASASSALTVIPASNLEGTEPVAVGSAEAMNRYGTHDMAGNVREWAWNREATSSSRFVLGGGWSDPDYAFTDAFAQSPLDRSPLNGIRLMKYIGEEPLLADIERPLARPYRDFMAETPVDDATFELYRRQFDYDPTPLDAEVVNAEEGGSWRVERVEFNAAYGNERMAAYVAVPTDASPPFQVVVSFPGSGALYGDSPRMEGLGNNFFVQTGRAYVLPIYKSTYDRQDGVKSDYPEETVEYREHLIMWIQDFMRTVDYLETREDIDAERLAYYGSSWGGALGAQVPAIERRIKAVVLVVAGMSFQHALPEADHIHYVTRVTQPTLMINGQYDYFFPVESAQRPMFELLGTPEADKRWLIYPGTHSAPRNEIVKESLAWLDAYLGPVGQ